MNAVCDGCAAVCWEESHTDLLLLDRALCGLLDVGPDLRDVVDVLVGGDGNGLHKEFVAAAGVWSRVFLHGLEEHLYLDIAAGLDAARVGTNAVPGIGYCQLCASSSFHIAGLRWRSEYVLDVCLLLRSGGLDFEGDGIAVGVVQAQDLADLVRERAWERIVSKLASCAEWTATTTYA